MIKFLNKNCSCIPFRGGHVERGLVVFETGKQVKLEENGYYMIDSNNITMCEKPKDELRRLIWELGMVSKVVEGTSENYHDNKMAAHSWLPDGSSFIPANYLTFRGVGFYYTNDWHQNQIRVPQELSLDAMNYTKEQLIESLKELKEHIKDWDYYQS